MRATFPLLVILILSPRVRAHPAFHTGRFYLLVKPTDKLGVWVELVNRLPLYQQRVGEQIQHLWDEWRGRTRGGRGVRSWNKWKMAFLVPPPPQPPNPNPPPLSHTQPSSPCQRSAPHVYTVSRRSGGCPTFAVSERLLTRQTDSMYTIRICFTPQNRKKYAAKQSGTQVPGPFVKTCDRRQGWKKG